MNIRAHSYDNQYGDEALGNIISGRIKAISYWIGPLWPWRLDKASSNAVRTGEISAPSSVASHRTALYSSLVFSFYRGLIWVKDSLRYFDPDLLSTVGRMTYIPIKSSIIWHVYRRNIFQMWRIQVYDLVFML